MATLTLTAVTMAIGANSSIVDRPGVFVTLRAVSCIGLVAVAVVVFTRGGSMRMGAALVATSLVLALGGLTASNSPLPFAIGCVASVAGVLLVEYVCFSYPSGRIEHPAEHRLMVASTVVLLALTAANLLLSDVPPSAGPFVRCAGTQCPANALHVVRLGDGASNALSIALALATALTTVGVAVLVARRAAASTRLQRRSLMPLLAWTVLTGLSFGFYVAVRGLNQHARLLTPAAEIVAAIIAAMPFAIALGMVRGRVFAISALERMVAQFGCRPSLDELQRVMARVFADPTLELLFWRPSVERYVDAAGRAVDVSTIEPHRTITELTHHADRPAAIVHDPVLPDDVLEAAGSVVGLALENASLQAELSASIRELEASRKRVAAAADAERRRIERDLHDGAQQGLIALRIKLQQLQELAPGNAEALAPELADAGARIDTALDEIRNLAKGIYPAVLTDLGLHYALAAVARELPVHVGLHTDIRRRFAPDVETAIYFCCLEALQNVAKHCGPDANVDLRLAEDADGLRFWATDDGPGFEPALAIGARGVTGMRDRLEAAGGRLTITSSPGRGTTVAGHIPGDKL